MDTLLNGIFFKCFFCKVLTKITHRESVSPEHENTSRLLYQNNQINNIDTDIKGLFEPNVGNNTPTKNLFGLGFPQQEKRIGMNSQFINPNLLSKYTIN